MGHFIAQKGVSIDPAKINVVSNWPLPSNLKELRCFLGLASYYRRFVKDFGPIAKPLNNMIKKDAFNQIEESTRAFTLLNNALTTALVLKVPNISKKFIVETDASGKGIGAILMQ